MKCKLLFSNRFEKPKVRWQKIKNITANKITELTAHLRLMQQRGQIVTENKNNMIIDRKWAMPSRHTFTIKPIAQLLARYVGDGIGWVDPFAGENSPAEITNDMNPVKPTKFHLHAKDFAAQLDGMYNGVLFDPPYSLRQVKECYDEIGVKLFKEDSNYFPQNVKNEIANKILPGGYAISFGWNSQGFGKKSGFEIIEILLIAHGRGHNDTIVTVERKLKNLFN